MARKLRLQYPGAIYHVMNQGDHREAIFLDDVDRKGFLETLGEACEKTDWQIHAYCLMGNHFHLVVETPQPNLVMGMKWLLQTYTARFNRRHRFFGHLFSGRYKALLIDGSGHGYLRTVCEYVHLNPVRAKLLRAEETLSAYAGSSYPAYLKAEAQRPCWLRVDRVLGEYRIPGDTCAGRQRFGELMEQRRWTALDETYRPIRRGWCLGSEEFRQELLAEVSQRLGPNHYGEERHQSDEQKALAMLSEEAAKLGMSLEQLQVRPVGATAKICIARRLRHETTMSLKWIAEHLGTGSWKYLSNRLAKGTDDSDYSAQTNLRLGL